MKKIILSLLFFAIHVAYSMDQSVQHEFNEVAILRAYSNWRYTKAGIEPLVRLLTQNYENHFAKTQQSAKYLIGKMEFRAGSTSEYPLIFADLLRKYDQETFDIFVTKLIHEMQIYDLIYILNLYPKYKEASDSQPISIADSVINKLFTEFNTTENNLLKNTFFEALVRIDHKKYKDQVISLLSYGNITLDNILSVLDPLVTSSVKEIKDITFEIVLLRIAESKTPSGQNMFKEKIIVTRLITIALEDFFQNHDDSYLKKLSARFESTHFHYGLISFWHTLYKNYQESEEDSKKSIYLIFLINCLSHYSGLTKEQIEKCPFDSWSNLFNDLLVLMIQNNSISMDIIINIILGLITDEDDVSIFSINENLAKFVKIV